MPHCNRPGRQKPIEQHAWPLGVASVILAVENPDAIDEDAVYANRIADRARSAAWQVVDPTGRRHADRHRIEQQQVRMGADSDFAAIGDAVKPGLVAGQPARAFNEVEGSPLAHPMAKEIKPEPSV